MLVEIVGVAGSGKSTLVSQLSAERDFVRAPFISGRNPRHLVYFVVSLPRLLPLAVANIATKPRMTWADYKLMVYIMTWRRMLGQGKMVPGTVLLLDQGPLYAMVRLKAKNLGVSSTPWFEKWWLRMLEASIMGLSLVVWLDAPDQVLAVRINARAQSHAVKGGHTNEVARFIRRYRALFTEVINEIGTRGGPDLVEYDTAHATAEETAEAVKRELSARTEPSR